MSFDRRTSLVEQPAVPENPNRDKLRSKVGRPATRHWSPAAATRRRIPPPPPLPRKRRAAAGRLRGSRRRLQVKSSGYKHYTPEVVPREEPEMAEPSFSTLKSDGAIKPLEELSPPPRSKCDSPPLGLASANARPLPHAGHLVGVFPSLPRSAHGDAARRPPTRLQGHRRGRIERVRRRVTRESAPQAA